MRIKLQRKGEVADKSQRELMGLILSLLIIVVVVGLIFRLLSVFSSDMDDVSLALFNRIYYDVSYLDSNSSIVEFLTGLPNNKFKGTKGFWGFVVFPKDADENALQCYYRDRDGFINYDELTRRENVDFNCYHKRVCLCLFFASKDKNEIIFTKCKPVSTRLDLDEPYCFWFKDVKGLGYSTNTDSFYLKSYDHTLLISLKKFDLRLKDHNADSDIFNQITSKLQREFYRLKVTSLTKTIDKNFFNLSELEKKNLGLAIYSLPLTFEHEPRIYVSLIEKPKDIHCFDNNQQYGDNRIMLSADGKYLFNYKDTEKCRIKILKTKMFKGYNFVVFSYGYNPFKCSISDGFLSKDNTKEGYSVYEKPIEIMLLFNDTFNDWEKFKFKHLGKYVIAIPIV